MYKYIYYIPPPLTVHFSMTRSVRYQPIFNTLYYTLHTEHAYCLSYRFLNNVVITTVIEMVELVEILDRRQRKRSVERVRYVINNLLHLVIVKYGDISLVLCISTRLRLVTILSLLVKYLVIFHADPCNKSYIYICVQKNVIKRTRNLIYSSCSDRLLLEKKKVPVLAETPVAQRSSCYSAVSSSLTNTLLVIHHFATPTTSTSLFGPDPLLRWRLILHCCSALLQNSTKFIIYIFVLYKSHYRGV